jgi:hypothetical protein
MTQTVVDTDVVSFLFKNHPFGLCPITQGTDNVTDGI